MATRLVHSRSRKADPKRLQMPARVVAQPVALPAIEMETAIAYAKAEKAASTRKAYRTDFELFRTWCAERGAKPLPADPETVAAYLGWEAKRGSKSSTISRRIAAIRYAHRLAGMALPTDDERVRATMRGIRRSIGAAATKKAPATADRILAMAPRASARLADLRDRALLLIGFAGAFRRSELVALDHEDIEETKDGLRITIRQSKTDQEGKGVMIAIPRGSTACPVAALVTWLSAAKINTGPLFRPIAKGGRLQNARLTDRSVANIVKAHAKRANLDADFSGHSLRSGFLTSAAARGASIFKMADQSRHKSMDTLRGYVRDAELFRDHAGAGLL